jgi:L-rhamnose mutarotase
MACQRIDFAVSTTGHTEVRRIAAVIRLRDSHAEEYRRLHRAPWPTALDALRASNITNYSIFERDGMLFSYMEYVGSDYEADMAKLADDPATRSWWEQTDPCQEPVAGAGEGEWWAPAPEIFHLE